MLRFIDLGEWGVGRRGEGVWGTSEPEDDEGAESIWLIERLVSFVGCR